MGDADVRILDAHEVREETGSKAFVGGVLNPGSGGIHPLNYLHGLAEGSRARGIAIFQESPALRIRRENGRAIVETPKARCGRGKSLSPPTAIRT